MKRAVYSLEITGVGRVGAHVRVGFHRCFSLLEACGVTMIYAL